MSSKLMSNLSLFSHFKPAAILCSCLLVLGCQAGSNLKPAAAEVATTQTSPEALQPEQQLQPEIEITDIWSRIRHGYQLHEHHDSADERLEHHLQWFARRTQSVAVISQRSAPYIHYIVEELDKRGMPLELALLPMIESAYNPLANSSQRAAGLWQFMPATGRQYKLAQTHWYDGRRDVASSTRAALDYLTYLNNMFDGDWLLSLAAYNAGEGTVMRAIRRNRNKGLPTDYWSLQLPRETQAYVPKLLAVSRMIEKPELYELQLPEIANEPFFTMVELEHELELKKLAQLGQLNQDLLQQLNPAYNHGITIGGKGQLLLPVSHAEQVRQQLSRQGKQLQYQWPTYKVQSGDNLSVIARRKGVSIAMLRDLNNLSSSNLRIGQVLRIPPRTASAIARPTTRINHIVQSGDNLSTLAMRYQVSVSQIRQWNRLRGDMLRVGQTLRINSPVTYYTVRSGDSLYSIAARHNVSIEQIKDWNTLNGTILQPGQKLALFL